MIFHYDIHLKTQKKVFNLQMLYSISLFATAWLLTGSWIPGVLTSVYFTALGIDMTRISFTIPLRESFALPFWALQNAIITYFFKKEIIETETVKSYKLLYIQFII